MIEDIPPLLHLGVINPRRVEPYRDFAARTVKGPAALPPLLFGCRRIDESFVREVSGTLVQKIVGRQRVAWSIAYEAESPSDKLIVSWSSTDGWDVLLLWHGHEIWSARGFVNETFSELFYKTCRLFKHFSTGYEQELSRYCEYCYFSHDRESSELTLPDGPMCTMLFPIHTTQLARAYELFNDIDPRKITARVFGQVVLSLQTISIKGSPAEFPLRQIVREFFAATGILCAMPPRHVADKLICPRRTYSLCISTPYHQIEQVRKHFAELVNRTDPLFQPLLTNTPTLLTDCQVPIDTSDGRCIVWHMGKEFKIPERAESRIYREELYSFINQIENETYKNSKALGVAFRRAGGRAVSDYRFNEESGRPAVRITYPISEIEKRPLNIFHPQYAGKNFNLIVGSILDNPFGPSMILVGWFDEYETVHKITLNPAGSTITAIGTIDEYASLALSIDEFPKIWKENAFTRLFVGRALAPEISARILHAVYSDHVEETAAILVNEIKFPTDVYKRFDNRMQECSVEEVGLGSCEEAVDIMVGMSLDPGMTRREIEMFEVVWHGCETYMYRNNVATSLATYRAFLFKYCKELVAQ